MIGLEVERQTSKVRTIERVLGSCRPQNSKNGAGVTVHCEGKACCGSKRILAQENPLL
jgi:hypothetical protein